MSLEPTQFQGSAEGTCHSVGQICKTMSPVGVVWSQRVARLPATFPVLSRLVGESLGI